MINLNNHTIQEVEKIAKDWNALYNSYQDRTHIDTKIIPSIPGATEGDYTVQYTITQLKPLEMIEINFTEIV